MQYQPRKDVTTNVEDPDACRGTRIGRFAAGWREVRNAGAMSLRCKYSGGKGGNGKEPQPRSGCVTG